MTHARPRHKRQQPARFHRRQQLTQREEEGHRRFYRRRGGNRTGRDVVVDTQNAGAAREEPAELLDGGGDKEPVKGLAKARGKKLRACLADI